MSDVSVIGLGDMGSALARTLLSDGYSVTVWNRTPAKAAPLASAGAIVADSAAEAVAASPVTITCIASHDLTAELLSGLSISLQGKTIIELSTGGATEAESLAKLIAEDGGQWLFGAINAYPSNVGKPETVLLTVGSEDVWEQWKHMIKTLGGSSERVGDAAGILAVLFAALFTTRQGFMFGMIFGALVCKKAGVSLSTFSSQVPVTMGVLPSYHQYFADTAPTGQFESPEASMATYSAALDDALSTFNAVGARSELPQLFSDLAHAGMDAGLNHKALTALVELLSEE